MDPKAKRRPAGEKAPIQRSRHLLLRNVTEPSGPANALTPGRRILKAAVAVPPLPALGLA